MAFKKFPRRRKFKPRGKKLNSNEKKQVKTMIKRVVQPPEEKAIVNRPAAIGTIDNNGGNFIKMIGPAAGPTFNWSIGANTNQRIGSEIWVKRVELHWTDFAPIGSIGGTYRVVAFIDTEGDNTTTMFSLSQGFFNNSAAAGLSILSSYNHDTVGPNDRYRVLMDRVYDTNITHGEAASTLAVADMQMKKRQFVHSFPFKGMKVLLDPRDLALGNNIAETNMIYVWFIAGGTATMASRVNELRSCVYYTDA